MLDIPPSNDQNEQEKVDEEDEADDEGRSGGMPNAMQTSDVAKKSNVPSNGNVVSLSLEEL